MPANNFLVAAAVCVNSRTAQRFVITETTQPFYTGDTPTNAPLTRRKRDHRRQRVGQGPA